MKNPIRTRTSGGLLVSYDANHQDVVQRNFQALMRSVREGNLMVGLQISGPLIVLGELITIKGIPAKDIVRHLMFTGVIHLQSLPAEPALSNFIEAIGMAGDNYLQRPIKYYHVLLPLNINQRALKYNHNLIIGGVSLRISSWQEVQQTFELDSLLGELRETLGPDTTEDFWHWSGVPLVTEVRARDPESAFHHAEMAYELLLALINCDYNNHHGTSIKLGNQASPEPLAQVLPSAGYGVFESNRKLTKSFGDRSFLPFQSRLPLDVSLENISILLQEMHMNGPRRRLLEVYIHALRTYGRAINAIHWSSAFLGLWQTLEVLTTFDLGQSYGMGDVVKRVLVLLGPNELTHDFLDFCTHRRNAFVHEGEVPQYDDPSVFILEWLVRLSLTRFRQLMPTYPSRSHLSEYFRLARVPRQKLGTQIQVIESILNDKK